MLLINTTFFIEKSFRHDFLKWYIEIFLPTVKTVGYFFSNELFEIKSEELESCSFAAQFRTEKDCEALFWYESYIKDTYEAFNKLNYGKFVYFTTSMKPYEYE